MPQINTAEEWTAEFLRLEKQGLSIAEIKKKIGNKSPDGKVTRHANHKGGSVSIDLEGRRIRELKRTANEKVPDSSRQYFKTDDEFKRYKKSVARDKLSISKKTSIASKEGNQKFNKGHVQSAKSGGPTTSRNLKLETARGNQQQGRKSPNSTAIRNSGFSQTWDEDAINYLNPDGLPLEYSPKAKQRILNAPTDMVDEVTAQVDNEVWDRINKNPDARPIRTNPNPRVSNPPTKQRSLRIAKKGAKALSKIIPGPIDDLAIGGVMALGAGGLALLGGASPAQAGQVSLDTGVDIATGDLDGGTLANGELLYNQKKVSQILQHGPANTAAPTGDKKWDSVAQPFIKMLNGITPTPKKPDFKQTAISAFNTP